MQKAGLESTDDYKPEISHASDGIERHQKYVANLGKYHCTSRSHHGDLHIDSLGVKFISAIRKTLLWEVRYDQLNLIQKVGAGEGLLFVDTEDEEMRVSGLEKRNEVFSQIIGYSRLRWQVSG